MKRFVKSLWKRLAAYFLAGAFAVLPVVITGLVVIWVAGFVQELIGPTTVLGRALRGLGLQFANNETIAYLIGWGLVLCLVFALGVLIEMGAKRLIQRIADAILNRVPVIGSIYTTSRQLVDMLDKKDEADLKGMKAVFCFFGKENPTGVLALLTSPEIFHVEGGQYHAVIIPTAPVPVGGGLLFVPVNSVKPAEMSVEGLMSIYVSMGVTAPQFMIDSSDFRRPAE